MCKNCYVIEGLFRAAQSNPHQNYLPVIAFITALADMKVIELFAGDCPLDEVQKHIWDEGHYTIQHYFRCPSCNEHFYVGACIRGTPIYKVVKDVEPRILNTLWGKTGTYFERDNRTSKRGWWPLY